MCRTIDSRWNLPGRILVLDGIAGEKSSLQFSILIPNNNALFKLVLGTTPHPPPPKMVTQPSTWIARLISTSEPVSFCRVHCASPCVYSKPYYYLRTIKSAYGYLRLKNESSNIRLFKIWWLVYCNTAKYITWLFLFTLYDYRLAAIDLTVYDLMNFYSLNSNDVARRNLVKI